MADIIVLGWPRRAGFIDKLIGGKIGVILGNTDKSTFICHLEKPLILHKRIVIAAPPLMEYEKGFEQWLAKITRLAQELSIPIQLYCNELTEKAIKRVFTQEKSTIPLTVTLFDDWEDFLVLARHIREDDLFILVSAREGAPSYMAVLDNMPNKLEKYFTTNSRILIYPQQFKQERMIEQYNDNTAQPLSKGIETIQKIGKGIGDMFKKENDDEH